MAEIKITHSEVDNRGTVTAYDETGKKAGTMTYSRASEKLIIIDHTEVDPAFGGQGIGKKLVNATIDYARQNSIKIIPLCPFSKNYFDKNAADLQDVISK